MRRHDLDWLRVIVFGLLIFYHVGMFFVPWGWHIKNNVIYEWFAVPMYFLNQWRIPILFVISGMGTYYALGKRSRKQFSRERLRRLGFPLLATSFTQRIVRPHQNSLKNQNYAATRSRLATRYRFRFTHFLSRRHVFRALGMAYKK